ncbi:MAG: tetratricopeptide repeat protein [Planctomycetota bacterium]|nr:tetratricopeptide repeat protein [Planctomycetota bacterium]
MKRLAIVAMVPMIAVMGCGPKRPTVTVDFTYTTQPSQEISEQYMKVAVMNATMKGDTGEYDQDKWSKMTADSLRHYLQEARERHGIPFQLVDRQHVKLALDEQDLAAAGIADDSNDIGSAGLEGVGSILTSDITIKIDKQVGKKRTIDSASVFAHVGRYWGGGGGGGITTTEVDEEARNITVSCQFQLKDPAGNRIIVAHSALPSQEYSKTKASGFFGSSQTEADMTPRDQVIAGMIEKHMMDFLAKFIPTEISETVKCKPSVHEASIAGADAVIAENYEGGLQQFKLAIVEKGDDHASLFLAGVCCEKLERFDDARTYYKRASAYKPKDQQYRRAVQRISKAAKAATTA